MRDDLLLLRAGGDDRRDLLARLDALAALTAPELVALAARVPEERAARVAVVARAGELRGALMLARERIAALDRPRLAMRNEGIYFAAEHERAKVALLFPGQGSQHVGMLGELVERVESVRAWFDALDRAAARAGEPPPSRLILAGAARREELFDMQRGAQLGTVADLALHELLAGFGLRADLVIGHSNGEHAAMIAAGMVSGLDRDALCDAFVRVGVLGRALRAPRSPERMAAVSAIPRAELEALLVPYAGHCFLAMDNCPHQLIVAGRADAMRRAGAEVVAAGGIWGELPFARAYHTPLFADWAETLATWYDELPFGAPHIPIYSCLEASPLPDEPRAARAAIARQWTAPVRFRDTIEAAYAAGVRTFVEVGPDSKLTAFTDDILRGQPHVAVSASSLHLGGLAQLQHLAAELFTQGVALDLGRIAPRRTEWQQAAAATHRRLIARAEDGLARVRESLATHREEHRFTRAAHPFLDDHALGRGARRFPILPFTMSMALAARAAERLTGSPATALTNVRAHRWLDADRGAMSVRVEARRRGAAVAVAINDTAFEAEVHVGRVLNPPVVPPGRVENPSHIWTPSRFYRDYAFHGPGYQTLSRVRSVTADGIDADLIVRSPDRDLPLDPALLDAAGQLVAFWLLEHAGRAPSFGIFPYAASRVVLHARPLPAGTRVRCRGTVALTPQGSSVASFEFVGEDGAPVASIEELAQRLVEFPDSVAEWIFRGNHVPIEPEDAAFLDESGGVFERALAHLALDDGQLDEWVAAGRRRAWLLDLIAKKGKPYGRLGALHAAHEESIHL